MLCEKGGYARVAQVLRIDTLKRISLHVFVSTFCVAAATAFLAWERIDDSIVGIIFLTGVVVAASVIGVRLSLYVGLICALSFWYYFVPPYDSFQLLSVQDWVEVLSFMGSSLIVSRVADRARKQAMQADIRRADVERLYTLSQEMMLHDDAGLLMRDLPSMIGKTFGLQDVVLYVREQDHFYGPATELPRGMDEEMRTRISWSGATSPDEFSSIALMLGMKNLGTMAWRPDALSRDAATAIAAQVSVALTRAAAIETFTRIEAAREGERLRTALIDSLTHELRTPLTGIRAAATTLVHGEGLDEATHRDLISLLDEESARLDKLIGEAIEMAQVDALAVTVSTSPQYAHALFEQALEESRSALAGHPVTVDVDEPDIPVWFDSHLISRVLRHLIENAARYSPSGSPIVLRSRRADSRLIFTVEDCGAGIDAADLPLIFEKFYRGRQGKTAGKGTGMGLAITRAILQAHGGGIEAETTLGKGTTFHFWIPLVEKQPE
jgi:two-component system, OmpR family, sensor histidine kinase KdpD